MGTTTEPMATADEFATESAPTAGSPPRLFIKEMVMKNFKSYAGEQRVGPFHKVRFLSFLVSIFFFCVSVLWKMVEMYD